MKKPKRKCKHWNYWDWKSWDCYECYRLKEKEQKTFEDEKEMWIGCTLFFVILLAIAIIGLFYN